MTESERRRLPPSVKLEWKQAKTPEIVKQNPRGILRGTESKSSGNRAKFQNEGRKETRGCKMSEEPLQEALNIMMENRRQSFQFKNTGELIIEMATKPRGNVTLNTLPHIPAKSKPPRYSDDILNEAMIETPRGNGDFERMSGTEFLARHKKREREKGDFTMFPRREDEMKKELADEKIKNMKLQMELKQAKGDEMYWKGKYEEMVEKVRATIQIWVPEEKEVKKSN